MAILWLLTIQQLVLSSADLYYNLVLSTSNIPCYTTLLKPNSVHNPASLVVFVLLQECVWCWVA